MPDRCYLLSGKHVEPLTDIVLRAAHWSCPREAGGCSLEVRRPRPRGEGASRGVVEVEIDPREVDPLVVPMKLSRRFEASLSVQTSPTFGGEPGRSRPATRRSSFLRRCGRRGGAVHPW